MLQLKDALKIADVTTITTTSETTSVEWQRVTKHVMRPRAGVGARAPALESFSANAVGRDNLSGFAK
jgi:hypothetical protein